jgi:hypothetical protein
MTQEEWVKLIGGGFACLTAPFAVHPIDRERAKIYLDEAKAAGLKVSDAVEHAQVYLSMAKGWPVDESKELERVRQYFVGKLPD